MRIALLAGLVALLAGAAEPAAAASAVSAPCGSSRPTTYRHVIHVVMENHDLADVIDTKAAPNLTALAHGCGYASDYHGIRHPSLPNYIAIATGSTHGVTTDCLPAACAFHGASVLAQAWALPGRARVYAESMPRPCDPRPSGLYMPRHNVAVYLKSLGAARCRALSVPLGALADGPLGRALSTATLPALAQVIPNRCNDTHDCPVKTGDAWLGALVRRVVKSKAWLRRDTVIAITWDESEGADDDPIGLVVIAPTVRRGTVVTTRADHYALLRTTEELLGLPPLGAARSAPSLVRAFRLG